MTQTHRVEVRGPDGEIVYIQGMRDVLEAVGSREAQTIGEASWSVYRLTWDQLKVVVKALGDVTEGELAHQVMKPLQDEARGWIG